MTKPLQMQTVLCSRSSRLSSSSAILVQKAAIALTVKPTRSLGAGKQVMVIAAAIRTRLARLVTPFTVALIANFAMKSAKSCPIRRQLRRPRPLRHPHQHRAVQKVTRIIQQPTRSSVARHNIIVIAPPIRTRLAKLVMPSIAALVAKCAINSATCPKRRRQRQQRHPHQHRTVQKVTNIILQPTRNSVARQQVIIIAAPIRTRPVRLVRPFTVALIANVAMKSATQ
jgi:hypothetical protein